MILWQLLIAYISIIPFGCFLFPTLLRTCSSSFSEFLLLFWKSMSNFHFCYFHHVLLIIIEETSFYSYFFMVILILTTYIFLYLFISPLWMILQRCFRDLHLSGRKNVLRVLYMVQLETPNSSTRSAYVDFTIILLLYTVQISNSVYDWIWSD